MWLESIGLGLVILFMIIGFFGSFIPLLPGPMLVWFSALVYAVATKFTVVGPGAFAFITGIAIVASTADIWMSLLGAKVVGGSKESLLWGMGCSVLGFIVFNLFGALIGYAVGILYAEYRIHRDWRVAIKAGLGGLAGWGLSSVVEAAGALLMIVIFVWQLMTHS